MRNVNDVDDKGALDDVSADAHIEIAERRRVRRGEGRACQQSQGEQNLQNLVEQAN
jgi:hypothetical protein